MVRDRRDPGSGRAARGVVQRSAPVVGKRTLVQRLAAPARVAPPRPSVQRRAVVEPEVAVAPEGGLADAFAVVQRRASDAAPTSDDVHAAAAAGIAAPAQELPHRAALEASFGQDLGFIQAHVGGAAAGASADMGAEAYATGDHVAFAEAPGLHTAAHEVAHVLQQRDGAVQLAGGVGQAGDRYERQADDAADAVVRGERVDGLATSGVGVGGSAVQRREASDGDGEAGLPVGFEELIGGTLAMTVTEGDAAAAQTRARLLRAQLRALHRVHRQALARRLEQPAKGDALAAAFQQRLSTPERGRLLAILRDEAPATTEEPAAPAAVDGASPAAEGATTAPAGDDDAVLQSPDPAIDGRTVSDVGSELHGKARRYGRVPAEQQDYASDNLRSEQRILDDHDGVFGTVVNLFNDAQAPNPERWRKAIVDWGVVQTQLQAVLALQPTAANIRQMGELTEKGLVGWDAAMVQTSAYSDEMLRYLQEFSQIAGTINTGVQVTADIAMAAAITCAVIATGPAILAVGAKLATAAGATGATALAVKGTTALAGAGLVGSATRGGLQAGRAAGYESIEVIVEYSRTEKSFREATEKFDWAPIVSQGVDGLQKGFVDGVFAHGGLALEAVATRFVGKALARYLGPYAGRLYAQVLRRASERALTAGVAGGVAGGLDAGARAAIDGRPLPEILQAMESGAKLGAGAGAVLGGTLGARDVHRTAKLDVHAADLSDLYRRDQAAFAARYQAMADELPPDQLRDVMANVRGRLAPSGASTIDAGQARVRELHANYAFDDSAYHGTSSDMLDGLEATKGEILSAADLKERAVRQRSGEGELLSNAGGLKHDISIGHGEAGMGTSLAYADVADGLRQYNPHLYTWDDLNKQIRDLQDTLRKVHQLDLTSLPGSGYFATPLQRESQIVEKLSRLKDELRHRLTLPSWHPRRLGGPQGVENYPLMFEFDPTALPVTHRHGIKPGAALSGEASVTGAIDLRTRLRRVYAPVEHLPEVAARLRGILGHGNFEVLALEATTAVPATGLASSSRAATTENLANLEKRFEMAQRIYAEGARNGGRVDANRYFAEAAQP